MLLSAIKALLPQLSTVAFRLENGDTVPEHFHVTEVGLIEKRFIDCGGTLRTEKVVNFQLWDADDYEHRLKPGKLLHIITLSETQLGISDDLPVEVEYQQATVGRYDLACEGDHFVLRNKATACLARDRCGMPAPTAGTGPNSCTPGSSCCS